MAACALLLAAGIAACGSTPASVPLGGATNCGFVAGHFNGATNQGATQAEQCFSQAYHQCQAATLTFLMMGVDTGNTYTFTVQPKGSGGCTLAVMDKFYNANGGGSTRTNTYTCSAVTQQSDALQVQGCGDAGDIRVRGVLLVPTPMATR